MAVKIRLKRRGRKKLALYDIVVADARAPRDGRFIEKLGNYNPNTHPATTLIKSDKALQWLLNGAQPTNTARNILSKHGILLRKHLQVGVTKGAITQEEADKKWEAWQQSTQKQPTETAAKTSPQAPKKDSKPAKASPKAAAKSSSTSPAEQSQSTQASDSPAQQPADPQDKEEISAPPVSEEELPSASGEEATTPQQETTTAEKASADSPAKSTQDK